MSLSFEEASARIAGLSRRGWRLDLDRIRAFVELAGLQGGLGAPPGPRYIQVAGTNGKGSVTAMIQSMLMGQGYKTGGFFSPYVYDPRERIQVNGEFVPKELFAELTSRLWSAAVALEETEFEGPTEFEFKTALGIATWLETGCDWVALEVGVGGRLDATSVVNPVCGVIVSIGHDHMAILGDTLAKVAFEKAGIFKPGMKGVVGALPQEAQEAVEARAAELGVELWRMGREINIFPSCGAEHVVETPLGTLRHQELSMEGQHQLHNAALAASAMLLSGAALHPELLGESLTATKLPGRLESRRIQGREFLLDGAHNLEAARSILASVSHHARTGRIVMISAMLDGHDPSDFYQQFASLSPKILVPPIDFFRARDPKALAAEIQFALPKSNVLACASVREAIEKALSATDVGDVILVTGSFYLVGEVGHELESL